MKPLVRRSDPFPWPKVQPSRRIARGALAAIYTLARKRGTEAFVPRHPPALDETDRVYYRAIDGCEAPLFRLRPPAGATGEPILLAHGLSFGPQTMGCLAESLAAAGYDVFAMEHRGDRHAVPGGALRGFGFDEVAELDVPAALERVREISGFERVVWVGHSLGGLLGYAHLAHRVAPELAAIATLMAPVQFEATASTLRTLRMVAGLVPERWNLPLRSVEALMAPFARSDHFRHVAHAIDGPTGRALLLDGAENVAGALVKDIARWFAVGSFSNRHDTFDYLEGMQGTRIPALVVSSRSKGPGDVASTTPAREALRAQSLVLDETWGHLDPLLRRDARAVVHSPLVAWLATVRHRCW